MRWLQKLAALAVLILFLTPAVVHADVNDFVVTNFEADYYLTNDDPQGSLRVVENISVYFRGFNHGIERAIPNKYKGQSLKFELQSITSDLGTPTGVTTRSENNNTVLRIGDPDRTVTGRQQYAIEYTLQNVISFYNGHDELYWDVNGDEWQQTFHQVTARLHVGDGIQADGQLECFTGAYGSNGDNCAISQDGQTITAVTTAPLTSGQTLTIVAGIQKGAFRPATFGEKLRDNAKIILSVLLPPVIIGGYAFRRWWRFGRDPKGRGTIIPEYDAPDDMSPAEVGTVADFRADQRDITATIIDLAVRGFIRIIEEKQVKRLRRDTLEYSVELLKEDFSKLKDFENKILSGLFAGSPAGTIVTLDSLKNKFYVQVSQAQKQIIAGLVSGGYLKGNPVTAGVRLWAIMAVLFAVVGILGGLIGPAIVVGGFLAAIPLFIFALVMPARTEKGVAAKEHALGLKLYMETAEADRIRMMQSPDAPYARTAEPKRTVDLYERLLPYAIVFGVEKQWSEEFKDIYTSEPDWYSGSNTHTFNTVYLASTLNGSMNTAMTTAFSSPSSSGSSGFGGGGFSGGGGGGGGGGGW